eukprot:878814_1
MLQIKMMADCHPRLNLVLSLIVKNDAWMMADCHPRLNLVLSLIVPERALLHFSAFGRRRQTIPRIIADEPPFPASGARRPRRPCPGFSETNCQVSRVEHHVSTEDPSVVVGGDWKSVHRQEDSPTTASLYIRSPFSMNPKKEFTIEYRNELGDVQERHTVQANGIGDVYDTFDVGPDKDAHFWIKECEKNNPINSKLYSYVGVSKPVESDGNHWNGALYYASGQKRYHGDID